MSKRTDDSENFTIPGTLTILSGSSSGNGTGCLEVIDTVYTDTILPNTLSGTPVNVHGVEFLSKVITMSDNGGTPGVPTGTKEKIYLESGLLKSIDSGGSITVYQPTTAKADILTHNGTTQVRLPVSSDYYLLGAKQSESSGLKWFPAGMESYVFQDVKASGTNGGNATTGAWTTRVLNTSSVFPSGRTRITLASNVMTVQPGIYRVNAYAPFIAVNTAKTRLFNNTSSSVVCYGTNCFDSQVALITARSTTFSFIDEIITISSTSDLILQYYAEGNSATYSLGQSIGLTGISELYTQIRFTVLE